VAVWIGTGADPQRFPPELLAAERAAMPGWRWKKEYRGEFDAQTGQPVFPSQVLDWQRQHLRNPALTFGYRIERDWEGKLGAVLTERDSGPIRVYIQPGEQPQHLPTGAIGVQRLFGMGADVSEGVGASDSAAVVLTGDTREEACEFADNTIEPADFGRVLVALARYYSNALICCVRPLHGITVLRTMLDEQKYGRVWREKTVTGATVQETARHGWAKGEASSPALFGTWIDELNHNRVILHGQTLLDQHRQYIYDQSGRITQQALATLPPEVRHRHGDLVIAAALASRAVADLPRFGDVIVPPNEPHPTSLLAARARWKREEYEASRDRRWEP
jgi:hypothetical protein